MGGEVDGDGMRPTVDVVFGFDGGAVGDAGVVDEDVDAAEVLGGFGDHFFDGIFFGDVYALGADIASGIADFLLDDVECVLSAVYEGEPCAFVGEQVGGRAAHAAGSTGYDGDFPLDGAAKFGEACHGRLVLLVYTYQFAERFESAMVAQEGDVWGVRTVASFPILACAWRICKNGGIRPWRNM